MSEQRMLAIRERMNLVPSYAAMMPGQWATQTRYHLMGLDNIADMAPITIMGHKVYGVFIEPGMGLRQNDVKGTAVDAPMIPSGMCLPARSVNNGPVDLYDTTVRSTPSFGFINSTAKRPDVAGPEVPIGVPAWALA